MDSKFKYDLAISLSAKDAEIADKLYEVFDSYSIRLKVYYYKKDPAGQISSPLTNKSREVYTKQSRHALILVSKDYDVGGWASFEWGLITSEDNLRNYRYLFIIRVDDTDLKFLSEERVFQTWNGDAFTLANNIHNVIDADYEKSQQYYDSKKQEFDPYNSDVADEPDKPSGPLSKIIDWLKKFSWQVSVGVVVTIISAIIIGQEFGGDKTIGTGLPEEPECPEKPYDLSIEAPRHANKGVYINSGSTKISSLDNTGRAQLQGISICDTLYLGTGSQQSNRIIITQTHINEGTIIYHGN